MKTYTVLLTIVSILFLTGCKSSEGDADAKKGQETQETTQNTEQEVLKDAAVWTAEMSLEGEAAAKNGTVTFFETDKVKIKDGDTDKTYTYKYIDSGAAVELTNVDKADEVLYFMLTDATDEKEVWESVDAEKQAVWVLTKK